MITNAAKEPNCSTMFTCARLARSRTFGAASLLTIGVWGTVLAAEVAPDRQTAALILILAGVVMLAVLGFWGVRRLDNYHQVSGRRDHLTRVFRFDRQLAQLDNDLEKRLRELEETLEEMTKGPLGKM